MIVFFLASESGWRAIFRPMMIEKRFYTSTGEGVKDFFPMIQLFKNLYKKGFVSYTSMCSSRFELKR